VLSLLLLWQATHLLSVLIDHSQMNCSNTDHILTVTPHGIKHLQSNQMLLIIQLTTKCQILELILTSSPLKEVKLQLSKFWAKNYKLLLRSQNPTQWTISCLISVLILISLQAIRTWPTQNNYPAKSLLPQLNQIFQAILSTTKFQILDVIRISLPQRCMLLWPKSNTDTSGQTQRISQMPLSWETTQCHIMVLIKISSPLMPISRKQRRLSDLGTQSSLNLKKI